MPRRPRRLAKAFPAVVAASLLALHALAGAGAPALAAGNGGSDSGAAAKREDPDYAAGVGAIDRGDFVTAIRHLQIVVSRDGASADAYNWLAYAVRRNGDPAKSIPIYEKALALDPKHKGAHEYIGEAYLALDNLPKAKEHLARLDKLCFFPCSEYSDLKKAVQAYEQSGGKVKPGGK